MDEEKPKVKNGKVGAITLVEDENDARGFLESFGRKKPSTTSPSSVDEEEIIWQSGSKDAEDYDMRHKRRGVAVIFNHVEFAKMTPRSGTKKDCQDLQDTLASLAFEVRVYEDLIYKELKAVLAETSREDHSDADCLLVAVMSHGEPGHLFSRDLAYREEELWKNFTGDKCPTLVGKPKLFFIQACRGTRVDAGVRITTSETDSVSTTYMIPREADILLAYSTVPGYYSWRSPLKGSWYIQALCAELNENGRKRDLLTMLTFVNRRVAVDYLSTVPGDYRKDMKNQMPAVTSMLTRLVFFHDNGVKVEKKGKAFK